MEVLSQILALNHGKYFDSNVEEFTSGQNAMNVGVEALDKASSRKTSLETDNNGWI